MFFILFLSTLQIDTSSSPYIAGCFEFSTFVIHWNLHDGVVVTQLIGVDMGKKKKSFS